MKKLSYKARFVEGKLVLKIYLNGEFLDEIEFPNLPVFSFAVTTQALWVSFFESISNKNQEQ